MGIRRFPRRAERVRRAHQGEIGVAVCHLAHEAGDLQADPVIIRIRRFAAGAGGEEKQGREKKGADLFSEFHGLKILLSASS